MPRNRLGQQDRAVLQGAGCGRAANCNLAREGSPGSGLTGRADPGPGLSVGSNPTSSAPAARCPC